MRLTKLPVKFICQNCGNSNFELYADTFKYSEWGGGVDFKIVCTHCSEVVAKVPSCEFEEDLTEEEEKKAQKEAEEMFLKALDA